MAVLFSRETFDQIVPEMRDYLTDHWLELAMFKDKIPLDPDYDKYKAAGDLGIIRFYSCRDGGYLVGYAIYCIVDRHMHYAHRWAVNDIVWLLPDYRNAGVGNAFFDFIEGDLSMDGPIVIYTEDKDGHPELGGLLRRRGHERVGTLYGVRLG